jgi:hypothetical protein
MATKLDPGSDRVEACHRAALELVSEHGSVNKAAKATGLVQQTLNDLVGKRKLGIDFADQVASVYETTVDGLVWLLLKGGEGAVRAGDIPGWAKALEEAEQSYPDYPYGLAAEVRLPVAPRVATKDFVRDLGQFLYNHTKTSGARIRLKTAAK